MRQVHLAHTAPAERSPLPALTPFRVIAPIRTLRKELGLTPNDLVTLQALISYLPKPGRKGPSIPIVFPSNASLSERTNGLNERTIRRCIGRLVDAGLILRRDSATRKRFPLRHGGVIDDAFGFDLRPMYDREGELLAHARQVHEDRERLRSLRAKALALRTAALREAVDEETVSFLQQVRNILRRATIKAEELIDLIANLTKIAPSERDAFPAGNPPAPNARPEHMSANDGQNVRHVEPTRLNEKKDNPNRPEPATLGHQHRPNTPMDWNDLKHISDFFPTEPNDHPSIVRILADLGTMLRIEHARIMRHLRDHGPGRLLLALDELVFRVGAGQVTNSSAYLDALLGRRAS